MKQYITLEQLNELSEKGKERLREWANNKSYDDNLILTDDGRYFQQLSIGQIIEFLDENKRILVVIGKKKIKGITWKFEEEELCDALWKAVKNILNK